MRWYTKALLQKVLSLAPNSHLWNTKVKSLLGIHPDINRGLSQKLDQIVTHLANYREAAPHADLSQLSVFELGTGVFPIIPISLWLAGVKSVRSVDIVCLTDNKSIAKTVEAFATDLTLRDSFSGIFSEERVEGLLGIHAAIENGSDARAELRAIGLEFMKGDLVLSPELLSGIGMMVSNNVLEHIPENLIGDILETASAQMSSIAVMSHYIDLSDHYSHTDRDIGSLHFLRFSDRMWSLINNKLSYQNRLRATEYREYFGNSDWNVVKESCFRPEGTVIEQLKLDKRFQSYSPADVVITGMWIVANRSTTS